MYRIARNEYRWCVPFTDYVIHYNPQYQFNKQETELSVNACAFDNVM